ncbi:hypothetical protein ABIE67_000437 [Streptomyces sp. V4I8]
MTWLLEHYGSPGALRKAGRRRLVEVIRPKAPCMATRLIDDVFDAPGHRLTHDRLTPAGEREKHAQTHPPPLATPIE